MWTSEIRVYARLV